MMKKTTKKISTKTVDTVVIPDCPECQDWDAMLCPYCLHNCDLQAKTIRSDEDAHCNRCGKDSLLAVDGMSYQKMEDE
jgi:hypothetical protein